MLHHNYYQVAKPDHGESGTQPSATLKSKQGREMMANRHPASASHGVASALLPEANYIVRLSASGEK